MIGFHVEGHAGYADYGQDIVCSAVSVLVINCINSIDELTDASVLLEGETPRLIDEWQLAPKLWDAIRFEVDHRHDVGQVGM